MTKPVDVSFEFFPPHDAQMEETLWNSVQRLAPLKPRFVSVTYGADGSTRDRTHKAVARIVSDTDLTAAPHLTCVAATREEKYLQFLELAAGNRSENELTEWIRANLVPVEQE